MHVEGTTSTFHVSVASFAGHRKSLRSVLDGKYYRKIFGEKDTALFFFKLSLIIPYEGNTQLFLKTQVELHFTLNWG